MCNTYILGIVRVTALNFPLCDTCRFPSKTTPIKDASQGSTLNEHPLSCRSSTSTLQWVLTLHGFTIWQEFKANSHSVCFCFSLSEVGISIARVDRNFLNNNQLVITKNSEFVIFFLIAKNTLVKDLLYYSQ